MTYADDIVIVVETPEKLNKLIDIQTREIDTNKININTEKTKSMVINKKHREKNQNIFLTRAPRRCNRL